MKIKWLAFFIFSSVIILFLYQAFGLSEPEYSVLLPLFVLLSFGIYDQFKKELKQEAEQYNKNDLLGALMVVLGFAIALSLSYFFKLPVVMASAITGITGYIFIRKFEKEIYCGSFAGMVAVSIVDPLLVTLIVIFLPTIYLMSKSIFRGVGGKLGTIAFVSILLATTLHPSYESIPAIAIKIAIPILILVGVPTTVLLYAVKQKFKLSGVIVSSAFSLLASLIFIHFANGDIFTSLIFALSFIIMTDEEHVKDISFLIISAIILSFLFSSTSMIHAGLGGKAGLLAMISVIMTKAVVDTFYKTLRKSN